MNVMGVFSDYAVAISEFKNNPMAALSKTDGQPLAVLNRNQPAFYCVPADVYEALVERLEDLEDLEKIQARRHEEPVEVSIDELRAKISAQRA